MPYVLKQEKTFPNGNHTVVYYKKVNLGLFVECTTREKEAKRFKYKKDAIAAGKATGQKWEAVPAQPKKLRDFLD